MTAQTARRLSVRQKISQARLYCVTQPLPGRAYLETVESALKGGADVVQLRDKELSGQELVKTGHALANLCRKYNALFILNDRLDAALACGADGVHLGQDDLPLPEARRIAKTLRPLDDFLIGCSTHSIEQALKAQQQGADYLGCGPVFATPTKPDYEQVGLELVKQYRQKIRIPFVAIGGVDASNIESVLEAGATCVAVVRSVFAQADIEQAARALKSRVLRS